jgi:2-polyprenyl-3-methyl-5-hydroxy-6-metoxy-1,4-benzoquinol methylase
MRNCHGWSVKKPHKSLTATLTEAVQPVNEEHVTKHKAHAQLQMFLQDCARSSVQGARLLEIGAKNGLFLKECAVVGLRATGTEIVPERVDIINKEHPELDVVVNTADSLPLPSNAFDYVVSFQVLEHMSHLNRMFEESVRVLKPGGRMYHVCPNYKSFYEGHYRILWLPFLRKLTGALYLRLLGKSTQYFENSVFPVTPGRLHALLSDRQDVEILSLGRVQFMERFTEEQIRKVNNRPLRKALYVLYRIGPPTRLLLRLIALSGLYYPITLIAEKRV